MGRQFSCGPWDATVLRMETSCSASRSRGRSKRRSRRRRRERSVSFKRTTREATSNERCSTGGSLTSVKATKLESLGSTTSAEISQWVVSRGSCGGGTSSDTKLQILVNETRVGNGLSSKPTVSLDEQVGSILTVVVYTLLMAISSFI